MKIVDKIIHPYLIDLTSENYDVLEDINKVNKEGVEVFKNHGHFSSVQNALQKVQKLLVEKDKTYTISEYLSEMQKLKIQIEVININK